MKWSHYWANAGNAAMVVANLWGAAFFISGKSICTVACMCWVGMFLWAHWRCMKCKEREFQEEHPVPIINPGCLE